MKNIIKQFLRDYFLSVGIVTVIVFICYYAFEKIKLEKAFNILGIMLIAVFPISLLGAIIFRNIHTSKELWIRRSIIIAVACIDYPLCFILFNMVKKDTITQYAIFFLINIFLISVPCIVAYIIADKIEQKKIEEINKKLNELK